MSKYSLALILSLFQVALGMAIIAWAIFTYYSKPSLFNYANSLLLISFSIFVECRIRALTK